MKVEVHFNGVVELEVTNQSIVEPIDKAYDENDDISQEVVDNLYDYVIEQIAKELSLDTDDIDIQDIYATDDKYGFGYVLYE
jgi:cell division protein FtsL